MLRMHDVMMKTVSKATAAGGIWREGNLRPFDHRSAVGEGEPGAMNLRVFTEPLSLRAFSFFTGE